MTLYRLTFQTEILVDASDEREAERIGYNNLEEKIGNGNTNVYSIKEITTEEQLLRGERGSLPWRNIQRDWAKEPELTVEEILKERSGS
jgi:hypothetical protein